MQRNRVPVIFAGERSIQRNGGQCGQHGSTVMGNFDALIVSVDSGLPRMMPESSQSIAQQNRRLSTELRLRSGQCQPPPGRELLLHNERVGRR